MYDFDTLCYAGNKDFKIGHSRTVDWDGWMRIRAA